MEDQINNRQREVLLRLLANPADNGSAYLSNLQELVKLYPQSGLFRAMYGRALNQATPLVAGGYFDSHALHKLMFHYDGFAQVDNDEVVMQSPGKLFGAPAEPVATSYTPPVTVNETTNQEVETVSIPYQHAEESSVTVAEHTVEPVAEPFEESLPEYTTAETFEPATNPWQQLAQEPVANTVEHEEPLGRAPWEMEDDEDEHQSVAAPDEQHEPEQQPAEDQHTAPVTEQPVDDHEPGVNAAEAIYTPTEEATEQYHATAEEPWADWQATPAQTAPAEPVWEIPYREEETEQAAYAAETPQEENIVNETPANHDDLADKLAYYASLEDEYDMPQANTEHFTFNGQQAHIDDETYDEITGIDDINLSQLSAEQTPAEPAKPDEADKLIIDNIVSTDFFRFDKAFGDTKTETHEPAESEYRPEYFAQPHQESAPQHHEPVNTPQAEPETEHHDVSMYHDDKMPYTFMWWLDKTRRDFGSLYQPYTKAPVARPAENAAPATAPAQGDALQQQYVENIFHISTPEGLVPDADAKTVEFDMQSKEDRIIQRFITEDPHIHPPVGEKLDTENKAKKSSEDSDEMVTETLARIYADQMLFPKAIATYKKLMLKFPEKSRYFASRIENLEKKTN